MGYLKHKFGQGKIPLGLKVCIYYGFIVGILVVSVLLDLGILPAAKSAGHATLICFVFVIFMEIREYVKYRSQK